MDAFVLVDYDNLPAPVRRGGLFALAWRLEASVSGFIQDCQDIHIRLYGGWYGPNGLTNAGTQLTQEIAKDFPILIRDRTRVLRQITCEIASSLIDSRGEVFLFTMRPRRGMRSVLNSQGPPGCADPAACTLGAAVQWSRGSCPHATCRVSCHDAFNYTEQKLTDTLLCADVFALARRVPTPAIFVLSNDDDMTPPILLAAKMGAPVFHVRSSVDPKFYDGILRQNRVQILVL